MISQAWCSAHRSFVAVRSSPQREGFLGKEKLRFREVRGRGAVHPAGRCGSADWWRWRWPLIFLYLCSCSGDTGNWYSSDEDEGGSSVTSILKTLRQQTSSRPQASVGDLSNSGLGDPRLQKGHPTGGRLADPRLSRDPRLTRHAEASSGSGPGDVGPSDPRLARSLPNPKPEGGLHSSPAGPSGSKGSGPPPAEEEEGERALREKAMTIPLDPLPGPPLRDPRSQLQQFSHIKKDVTLSKPSFARTVLWNPEDLIPLPIPKQDAVPPVPAALQSMPTLDPRLHRGAATGPPNPRQRLGTSTDPGASSSNLPDFELLSRILKTVNATGPSAAPGSSDKPSDPRVRKAPTDPRLQKPADSAASSRAAKPGPAEAPSPAASPSGESSPPATAPYDPRVLAAGGLGQGSGSGQSSVLSGISLYDPRTPNAGGKTAEPAADAGTQPKGPEGNGKSSAAKAKEPPFVRKSALEQPESGKPGADGGTATATDRYNSYNRPRPKASAAPTATPGAPPPEGAPPQPGVHNLPVPTLFGTVKQTPKTGSGSPFAGNSPAREGEQDAGSLKDVFKGFDPTASPFCQ